MYHGHFALREEPFGVSPDSRFFYQTEQHRALGSVSQCRKIAVKREVQVPEDLRHFTAPDLLLVQGVG